MIFSYADPSSKIAAADDTPRSSPCLCRMQRLFVSCCPGVPDSQNIISYETAHERNYLEIRETPFPLTGWKRNGCRSPRQIFQPLRCGNMAHHRSRTRRRRLAAIRLLLHIRMGVGLSDALRAGIPLPDVQNDRRTGFMHFRIDCPGLPGGLRIIQFLKVFQL